MNRRDLGRALAWVIGVPTVLVGAAILVVVLVNWNDEPPSGDAQRLLAMKHERPHVDDAANGYLHALALAAPRDFDPVAMGRARSDFIEAFAPGPEGGEATGLPGRDEPYRSARTPGVASLARACTEAVACLDALDADPAAFDAWLASEHWLLDRYRRMLETAGWREALPGHVNAPFPAWQHAMEAQKLQLLAAHAAARAGDAEAVRDLLQHDHAFWRRVLVSSETLVSKMIAIAAVRRNLSLGNLALRELPPGPAAAALPQGWREPITVSERSLARALAGEWNFMTGAMQAAFSPEALAADPSLPGPDALAHRLFQKQATANLSAARMVRLGEVSELPYPDLAAELDRLARPVEARRTFKLYNPIGHILDSIATPAYVDYIARASDLEVQRHATVFVAGLRATGTRGEAVADAIHGLPAEDAAANGTLEWDAAAGAVVVHGLAAGDKGRFAILY